MYFVFQYFLYQVSILKYRMCIISPSGHKKTQRTRKCCSIDSQCAVENYFLCRKLILILHCDWLFVVALSLIGRWRDASDCWRSSRAAGWMDCSTLSGSEQLTLPIWPRRTHTRLELTQTAPPPPPPLLRITAGTQPSTWMMRPRPNTSGTYCSQINGPRIIKLLMHLQFWAAFYWSWCFSVSLLLSLSLFTTALILFYFFFTVLNKVLDF